MRKAYLVLAIITALFTSCSSDSEDASKKVLVKQITTVGSNGENHIMKYFYEGNRISYILTDDNIRTEFMYATDKDLILLVRVLDGNTLISSTSFSYYSHDIIFEQRYNDFVNGNDELITYDQNDDNTLTRKRYDGIDPWPFLLTSTSKINVDGKGRFTKIADWDGTNWITKSEATYGNYNSPFENINAFDKIFSYIDAKNSFRTYVNYDQNGNLNTTLDFVTELTSTLGKYPTFEIQTIKNSAGTIIGTTQTEFIYY